MNKPILLCLLLWVLMPPANAQNTGNQLFDNSYLHDIHIYFAEADFWELLSDNYNNNPTDVPYMSATQIVIDGTALPEVGVRQKGFSSHFASNYHKKSLKVDFDRYVADQVYDGLKKINLHNGVGDPSFLRDALCYDVLRQSGAPAPRTSHARLYLNDQYWGIYLIVEQVDKTFLNEHFSNNDGNLFKNTGWSSLHWLGSNPNSYQTEFELKTNELENDWSGFVNLIDVINNSSNNDFPEAIQQVFDVSTYLKILAIDILTNNWDSYIEHGRNWYLYQNPDSDSFHWIPWDYNLALGGDFNTSGNPAVLDTICQIVPDFSFVIDEDTVYFNNESMGDPDNWTWDFGDSNSSTDPNPTHIYANEDIFNVCFTITKQYTDTLCTKTTCRSVDLIFNVADCPTVINGSCPYPANDPVLLEVMLQDDFCCLNTWDGICQDLYDDISSGGGGGPGGGFGFSFPLILDNPDKVLIERLMDVPQFREEYLEAVCQILDNNFIPERLTPIIDNTADLIRDGIYDDPYYLFTPNYFEYDVGYGGQANGASIPQLKVLIDLRIAEIEEDLEEEGHNCEPLISPIAWHDVVINELVASNDSTSGLPDPAGEFDDWIEFYNNTSTTIDLTAFYLTDNASTPQKWAFPFGTTIAPEDYLIVWADQQIGQQGLHANFRLNKEGEYLSLVHADGTFIDSLSFGPQTTNVGYARVPNGTGPFQFQQTTFNESNDIVSSTANLPKGQFSIYPNPTSGHLTVHLQEAGPALLTVRTATGKAIMTTSVPEKTQLLDLTAIPIGVYLLELQTKTGIWVERVVKW